MWTRERWKQQYKKSFEHEKKFICTLYNQELTFYATDRYIGFLEEWVLELKAEIERLKKIKR